MRRLARGTLFALWTLTRIGTMHAEPVPFALEGIPEMHPAPKARSRTLLAAMVVAALLGSLLVSGCNGSSGKGAAGAAAGSAEATVTALFPATGPKPAEQPPPPMLRDPRTAAYSYLLWISYAYRVLNSDVASQTFDPFEEVRVNSYVQYNLQEGRAIDQRLLVANLKDWESKGSTATVAMHEEWAYRYIDTKTGKYSSPVNRASYETTYTVVKLKSVWKVHSVEATSSAPVK